MSDDQAFHSQNHACPACSLAGLPCPRGIDEISLTLLDTTMTIITNMTIKKHLFELYSGVRPWRHGVAPDLARRPLHLPQQDHRLQDLLRSQGENLLRVLLAEKYFFELDVLNVCMLKICILLGLTFQTNMDSSEHHLFQMSR